MSRAAYAVTEEWVIKYDFEYARRGEWNTNAAEIKWAEKFPWLPRTVPIKNEPLCTFQERGERTLEDILRNDSAASVVEAVSSFIPFAKEAAMSTARGGVKMGDFKTHNIADNRRNVNRPWLIYDLGNWKKRPGPVYDVASAVTEVVSTLNKHDCFEQAVPGLWAVCAEWLRGPEVDSRTFRGALDRFLARDPVEGLFPKEKAAPDQRLQTSDPGVSAVPAVVAAWGRSAEAKRQREKGQEMRTVLPWAIPEEDPEESPVQEAKVQKLAPTRYPLSSIVLGDSTWKDLPGEEIHDGRRRLCIATPGGSIFTANAPKPAAILGLREALAQEDPLRPLLMYAYPMQGSTRGDTTHAAKHKSKTRHLGPDHFISKVLEDYAKLMGLSLIHI